MPSSTLINCPHEIRPGTTVCLHCRREARENVRARLRRTAARLGLVVGAVAICAAAGSAGVNALQHRRTVAAAPAPAADTAAAPKPVEAAPTLLPVIAEGKTSLRGDSVFAVRAGKVVTVHFDTQMLRTRRPEKFELMVRSTLPAVYGPAADSVLARVPQWEMVRGGKLVTELPVRGLQFPLAGGETLTVWPETKPGQDGPLVIAYRATVTP